MDFSFLCDDSLFPGEHIAGCLGHGNIETNLDTLLAALKNTVILSISALIVALIVGVIIGVLKTWPNSKSLRIIATIWVEFFRNIPLLVQLFLFYFVVPKLFPSLLNAIPAYILVIIALGFFTSARIAEQVRAAIESIPTGQRYAAMALGLKTWQTYRLVLLPRAIRTTMPPLISESMGLIKNSATAFAVGVPELLLNARQTTETTSLPIENYFLATLLYVLLALVIFSIMTLIEHLLRVPGFKPTQGE